MKKVGINILLIFSILILPISSYANEINETNTIEVVDGISNKALEVYGVNLMVDGNNVDSDVPAMLYKNRTLVPIRFVVEKLGAEITWNQDEHKATITTEDNTIILSIDSAKAYVNGNEETLPDSVPAKLLGYEGNYRTMVPLRFVSEQLGMKVDWIDETKTATVDYKANNEVELSLEEAIQTSLDNSSQLNISDLEIGIKEIELKQARDQEKDYRDAKDSGFSLGNVEGFQLDANMLSKSARYALEEEKIKKDYTIENIKNNATMAYYGVLQAKDALDIAKSNFKNVGENRDQTKKKLDLGIVSRSELIMMDISLDEAQLKVDSAQKDFEKALRKLNIVLNYPLDTRLNMTSAFEKVDFNADLESDLEKAYDQRFDMIQMNHNYELVKLDFETNAKKYTPNTYVYRTKEKNVAKIETMLNDLHKSVEADIKDKYDSVISAKKQIELSNANVERAKEGLRMKQASYNAGMATSLEIQEALNQLYTSESALSGAVSSYNLAILDYNKAVTLGNIN